MSQPHFQNQIAWLDSFSGYGMDMGNDARHGSAYWQSSSTWSIHHNRRNRNRVLIGLQCDWLQVRIGQTEVFFGRFREFQEVTGSKFCMIVVSMSIMAVIVVIVACMVIVRITSYGCLICMANTERPNQFKVGTVYPASDIESKADQNSREPKKG